MVSCQDRTLVERDHGTWDEGYHDGGDFWIALHQRLLQELWVLSNTFSLGSDVERTHVLVRLGERICRHRH